MADTLARWIGCQRVAGNAKDAEVNYLLWLRQRAILSPSWTDFDPQGEGFPLDQSFAQFKDPKLTPWLSEVPSQILRNGVVRYKRGWTNHWKNPGHFRRPRSKKKWEGNSVWLTRELFRFVGPNRVELGTVAHPIGVLAFVQHRDVPEPNSLVLTRTRYGHWFLSYSSDALEGPELLPDEERLKALAQDPDLDAKVQGIDRGIVVPVATSGGGLYQLDDAAKERLKRLEKQRKHYPRAVARKPKGSHRSEKAQAKASHRCADSAAIREDFLRQTSFRIAQDAPEVTALEDLNLKGMTKRAKAKRDEATGQWLRNGGAQKTGLNKTLANAGLGKFKVYLEQALRKLGKLLILVPAHHSSQECSACGHTEEANRPDQATFLCQRCGFADNADLNAAKIIRKRRLALIRTAGTAGCARSGQAKQAGRPQGRGVVRRKQGEQPSATPAKREKETSSFSRRTCAA